MIPVTTVAPPEDDSEHSTQTVVVEAGAVLREEKQLLIPAPLPATAPRRRRKRVRFDERHNQVHHTQEDEVSQQEEEKARCWYVESDYERFRSHRREQLAKAQLFLASGTCSVGEMMEVMFEDCADVTFIMANASPSLWVRHYMRLYQNNDSSPGQVNQDSAEQLNESDKDDRLDWVLGLELCLCRSVKDELVERREAIQQVVYDIQLEHEQEGLWNDSEDALSAELRESCRNYTQAPMLFAQLLARAQWESSNDRGSTTMEKEETATLLPQPAAPSRVERSERIIAV